MSATDDVTFKIGDASYPFVFPDAMTFPEQREVKRLSGGLAPRAVFAAMQDFDPDAWCAVMLVCMRRVDQSVKDNALDEITPMPLAVAVLGAYGEAETKDAAAVDADVPLAVAASAPGALEPQPAPSPAPETTPAASGAPA